MTDRKFTDEEVIKALECCMRGNHCGGYCPYDDFEECTSKLTKDALDLINRQKAEIEELKIRNERQRHTIKVYQIDETKTEAIKEFAEKLKEWAYSGYTRMVIPECVFVSVEQINDLVEEMTEETI